MNRDESVIIGIEDAQRQRQQRRAEALAERRYSQKKARAQEIAEAHAARRSFASGRRLLYLIIAVILIALVIMSGTRINDLKQEQAKAEQIYKINAEQKAKLTNELSMVNDPEYIELQAREFLHMIKPGEIQYIFNDKQQG